MTQMTTSLFLSNLHTEVSEDLLYEKFSPVGQIHSIRVCRHPSSGRSLGCAYLMFYKSLEAEIAADMMNYSHIKGQPVRIMKGQKDPCLSNIDVGIISVKNLHTCTDNKALHEMFSDFGKVVSCKVFHPRNASRGHGFVRFETDEIAERVIKKANGMYQMNSQNEWQKVIVEKARLHQNKKSHSSQLTQLRQQLGETKYRQAIIFYWSKAVSKIRGEISTFSQDFFSRVEAEFRRSLNLPPVTSHRNSTA